MTDDRAFLLDALRRVNGGSTVTNEELLGAIPNPSSLGEIEQSAWYRLSHWADDDDIRGRDPRYEEMQRRQIADALTDLEALEAGYLPAEVSRGEHQAWHVPLWGCLLAAALVALAAYLLARYLL